MQNASDISFPLSTTSRYQIKVKKSRPGVHFPQAFKNSEKHLQANGAMWKVYLLLSLCLVHFHFRQISHLAEAGLEGFAASKSRHSL